MIVQTAELSRLRGRVSMVDGGFDPIHAGHVVYFREAKELGLALLCNVSPDEWIARKHPPLLPQRQRVEVIDSVRYVDYTHASQTTTAAVLELLEPRYYVKGADWRGMLPEDETAICRERGIEVVYVDTVVDSSTAILERYESELRARAG